MDTHDPNPDSKGTALPAPPEDGRVIASLGAPAAELEPPPCPNVADRPPADPPCCEHLVREYTAYVLNLVRRLEVFGADAEDIVQDVFIAVHTDFASYRGEASIKAWISGICVRKVQAYKRSAWRRRRTLRGVFECVRALGERGGADPHAGCIATESIELLRKALAKLPHRLREVFVLHDIEGLTMREITAALEIPLDTGYTRLHEARRRVIVMFRPEDRA